MCSRYAVSHRHRHCLHELERLNPVSRVSAHEPLCDSIKGGRGASDHKTSWHQLNHSKGRKDTSNFNISSTGVGFSSPQTK